MDTVLGFRIKGGVILCADQSQARSILIYQKDLDKIPKISPSHILGLSGPNSDVVNFSTLAEKKVTLYETCNDLKLSTKALASMLRHDLAAALRKGPFQVQTLLGGWDSSDPTSEDYKPEGIGSLYFTDYMGSQTLLPFGVQGYASSFLLSIFDRQWKEEMTEEEGLELCKVCSQELKTRFLINSEEFLVKVVDKDGVREIHQGKF